MVGVPGIWSGLTDSVFLREGNDRERDPLWIAGTAAGGVALGLVAATVGLLLVVIAYALAGAGGARGLDGLPAIAKALADPNATGLGITVLRLLVATASDAVFFLVFVAFAVFLLHQPLLGYITAAPRIRWRLLALGLALGVAVMAPLVFLGRLADPTAPATPLLSVSGDWAGRGAYALASLLLIPAAAAEEIFFRGWLLRQSAVFVRRPVALIGFTSLAFAALHFDFNPDAFLTRALMGAGFAYMTLRLGGIEFSSGVHATNNIMIFLFLQPLSPQAPAPSSLSALAVLNDLALIGGYVAITEIAARNLRLRRLACVRSEELSEPGRISKPIS